MEKEITLITAFFDIGRKDFKYNTRTNEEYFEYFKVWGKMKNDLIVYTNKYMAKLVSEFREKCGLSDRTHIIIVDDENLLEPNILKKMKNISNNRYFLGYRSVKNATSNNYKYDYIMQLKYWCLDDAFKKGLIKNELVSWMDFGFNHKDACYTNPDEFNFTWKTNLSNDKIHIFALDDIKLDKPVFELIRTLEDHIMGCLIILPTNLCSKFWLLIKSSLESLLEIGFIDDDQLLLYMAYKKEESLFKVHISDWFLPLKENGASHLTVKRKMPHKQSMIIKLKKKIKYISYIKNLYKLYK